MSYCYEKAIPHSRWLSWPAADRAKMLAFTLERAEQCSLCGTSNWEWEENRFAYEPSERFCRGCYLKDTAAEDKNRLPGTTIELTPVTEMFRARQKVRHDTIRGMDMGDA